MNAVDVIVPIFNAAPDLARCLHALQTRTPAFARIWLIDDASTDAQIQIICRAFCDRASVATKLLQNPKNLGFVGTVNRAMALSKNDVVLLNSDTIVGAGWLEALAQAAQARQIGSITPFSNNAEICSFPHFCQNSPVPDDIDRVARAAAALPEQLIDLPTGVGFCMYLTRRALQTVGLFDAVTFGRGYGEENDWCLRARGLGFRNVLCNRAFVAHVGGSSFSATGEKPGGENLRRLLVRYPHYEKEVASFIRANPIAPARAQLLQKLEASV
jgi:GT2 family glycosyltransferase